MRLYIAGPISADPSRTVAEKVASFRDVSGWLMDKGYETVPAIDVPPECGLSREECTALTERPGRVGQGDHSWECYMKYDLRAMLLCDGVALLPKWLLSPGARIEVNTAIAVGLPVQGATEWLLAT